MIALVSLGSGLTLYLLVAALITYRHGETPGGLAKLLGELRGEQPAKRKPWWWAEDGQLTRRQRQGLTALAAAVLIFVGGTFFQSWPIGLLLALASPFYPRLLERSLRLKRREALNIQFGLALQVMAASLRAGASLRSAIERSTEDLERMLAGQPLKPMLTELERVVRDLQMGFSLEEALIRFRDRVALEDVNDFVGAVLLCRVRGGNAAAVMASIAEIIEDKISVRQQIQTLTAGKRMEGNMITFAPPVMVGLLTFTAPGYLTPLYERFAGQVLLVVGSACLVAAYLIGRRLMEIEV
ncbi:MAG TPA: type II secretion system F family protein [Symbiobacteriaceae bacterium]|nr:type II secretion system F family protein [Symbiobacteriaceae bacterium]